MALTLASLLDVPNHTNDPIKLLRFKLRLVQGNLLRVARGAQDAVAGRLARGLGLRKADRDLTPEALVEAWCSAAACQNELPGTQALASLWQSSELLWGRLTLQQQLDAVASWARLNRRLAASQRPPQAVRRHLLRATASQFARRIQSLTPTQVGCLAGAIRGVSAEHCRDVCRTIADASLREAHRRIFSGPGGAADVEAVGSWGAVVTPAVYPCATRSASQQRRIVQLMEAGSAWRRENDITMVMDRRRDQAEVALRHALKMNRSVVRRALQRQTGKGVADFEVCHSGNSAKPGYADYAPLVKGLTGLHALREEYYQRQEQLQAAGMAAVVCGHATPAAE